MSVDLMIKLGANLQLVIEERPDQWVAVATSGDGKLLDRLATTSLPGGFDGATITLLAAIAESRWPELAGWPPSPEQAHASLQKTAQNTPHSYQRVQGKPGDWSCRVCGADRNHPAHG